MTSETITIYHQGRLNFRVFLWISCAELQVEFIPGEDVVCGRDSRVERREAGVNVKVGSTMRATGCSLTAEVKGDLGDFDAGHSRNLNRKLGRLKMPQSAPVVC